jgi:predicted secreted protein
MVSKKAFCLITGVLVLGASALWAGDTASFMDLGFSPDGGTYMFGQYGVQGGSLRPWAELFIVDVPRNDFVTGGRVSYTHDDPINAGSDGTGALYRLVTRNTALAERHGVNFLHQGRPLYIALDTKNVSSQGEIIEFRDFETGYSYTAELVPTVQGSGAGLQSSFYIRLGRTSRNGEQKSYTVGSPGIKRSLIAAYKIKQVLIAPNDGSVIFVIETSKQAADGFDIRYMVEAFRP